MESTQRVTVLEEKLGLCGILNEAFKIPFRNPSFIIFSFITSLPTFCSLFIYENIYAGDKVLNLKQMLIKHVTEARIKGPLVTSIFVVLLTSLLSMGLISIALHAYITYYYPLFMMLFVAMFVALLVQYVKWSAIWNMGTLISILEDKEGDEALLVSAYISRGSRISGSLLMLVCVAWRLGLRLGYYFMGWNSKRSRVWMTMVYISLVCVANGFKWVAFVVYFIECRKWNSVMQVSQSA